MSLDISKIREVIQKVCKFQSEDINIPEEALDIQDLSPSVIIERIDKIFVDLSLNRLETKKLPSLEIPIRRRQNIVYNKDNRLFLGRETQSLEFGDEYSEYLKILSVAEIVKKLLTKDLYATKREIFYHDVILFKDQKYSDRAIEELATLLGVFRESLHILAAPRGICNGSLKIKESGYKGESKIIDFEDLNRWEVHISPMLHSIKILDSDAEFILVLEKDAAMIRLSESKIWEKIPCILLTSQGSPSYSPRKFLKMLVTELKIPAFGIADSDPYGLAILMTYAYGGVQSAHETSKLAINNFYWLGVTPQDIDEFAIPDQVQIPLRKEEYNRIEFMLNEPPIQKHRKLRAQLNLMKKNKTKVEIQALSSHGFDFYLKYIFDKIEEGELIKF